MRLAIAQWLKTLPSPVIYTKDSTEANTVVYKSVYVELGLRDAEPRQRRRKKNAQMPVFGFRKKV